MKRNLKFEAAVLNDYIAHRITVTAAAAKLGCSTKTVRRRAARLSGGGTSALRRKSSGRVPEWKTDGATAERIVTLYRTRYAGFNFSHFLEKLNNDVSGNWGSSDLLF